jgi:hypothetical protein
VMHPFERNEHQGTSSAMHTHTQIHTSGCGADAQNSQTRYVLKVLEPLWVQEIGAAQAYLVLDWLKRHDYRKAHASLRAATARFTPDHMRRLVTDEDGCESSTSSGKLPSSMTAESTEPLVRLETVVGEFRKLEEASRDRAERASQLAGLGTAQLHRTLSHVETMLQDLMAAASLPSASSASAPSASGVSPPLEFDLRGSTFSPAPSTDSAANDPIFGLMADHINNFLQKTQASPPDARSAKRPRAEESPGEGRARIGFSDLADKMLDDPAIRGAVESIVVPKGRPAKRGRRAARAGAVAPVDVDQLSSEDES